MTVRLRVDVGYDGGAFAGWAAQPGQRTVQGTLEEALGTVLRAPAALTVAGRTDAGVHATGQVCHVDVPAAVWAELSGTLLRRLNGLLPLDVRVTGVGRAPTGFDARFSALWRRYAYRLTDAPHGADPLRRHDTVPWRRPLDEAAMNAAAAPLLGEHDFAAYCRRREGASTVRALQRLYWTRTGHLLVATVRADAFCHNMVRALVGAMIAVGEGRRPPDWPAAVLAAGVRDPGVLVVPAHGLTLVEVGYPDPAGLADRAALTRRYRGETVV